MHRTKTCPASMCLTEEEWFNHMKEDDEENPRVVADAAMQYQLEPGQRQLQRQRPHQQEPTHKRPDSLRQPLWQQAFAAERQLPFPPQQDAQPDLCRQRTFDPMEEQQACVPEREDPGNGWGSAPAPPELCRLTTYDPFENSPDPCAANPYLEGLAMVPVMFSAEDGMGPCVSTQYLPYDMLMAAPLMPIAGTPPVSPALCPAVPTQVPTPESGIFADGARAPAEALSQPTQPTSPFGWEAGFKPTGSDEQLVGRPQPQSLVRSLSERSGNLTVDWTVDARKLTAADRVAVSAPFDLTVRGAPVTFRMMLYPRGASDGKGGTSFRKSRGKGMVQLKCEGEVQDNLAGDTLAFRIAIGSGQVGTPRWEAARGPVAHQLMQGAVCGLPRGQEVWDFQSVVDQESQTFVVRLEVLRHTPRNARQV
jgi:hypothetical protein